MLNNEQLVSLSEEDRELYETLEGEEKQSFEYFYGFAYGTAEPVVVTNKEVQLYQQMTDKIKLKDVCKLLGVMPHRGQQPIVFDMDTKTDVHNSYVIVAGRRFGKSFILSAIATRELLVPFSSTVLIAPTFNNARIIFNSVLKLVNQLKLPIKAMNKGSFRFELENGAKFTANSEANIESALGSSFSLTLYEEFSVFTKADEIHKQMIAPTLLDFGVRDSGILYGKQFFIGTARGVDNQLYDYFIKADSNPSWKSYTAPSYTNPTLPKNYFKDMKLELGEMLYNQEIEAKFVGTDENVFYALTEASFYDDGDYPFVGCTLIAGHDVGFSDSTAGVWLFRDSRGYYYLEEAYSQSMTSTREHIDNFRLAEGRLGTTSSMRYLDPSAPQTRLDWITEYDYLCHPANNSINESIMHINQLLTPTGANEKPKLYINRKLSEMVRQLKKIRWKDRTTKNNRDPFAKDPEGTHWDLIAALRYALYSDQFSQAASFISVTTKGNKRRSYE